MATTIPGLDVSEQPFDRSLRRLFIQDPGPGNPRVPAGGMSTAGQQASQGLRAPVATPAPIAPAVPVGPASLSGGLRTAAKALPIVGLTTAAMGSTPREDEAVGGAVDASKAKAQGLRETYGADTVSAAYKSAPDWRPFGTEQNMRPEALQSRVSAYTSENSGAGRGFIRPPSTGASPPAPISQPGQAPASLRTGTTPFPAPVEMPSPPGAGVQSNISTVPGMDPNQNARISASNQGVIDAARALDLAQGRTPGVAGIDGDGDRVAKAADFQTRADLRNRMMATTDPRMANVLGQQLEGLNRLKGEGLRNQSAEAIAQGNNDTQRFGYEAQADTARSGLRAKQQSEAAMLKSDLYKTMVDQGNKDRDFGLRQAEFGQRTQDGNLAARNTAEEGFRKSMESRFRTAGPDGKDTADTAKIGEFSQFVDAAQANALQRAQASGDPKQVQLAEQLAARGKDGLDPQTMNYNMAAFKLRDRIRQADGFGPGSAKFVDDPDPAGYEVVKVVPHMGKNRAITRNGSEFNLNDAKYQGGPANGFLPDWGKNETREFEPMFAGLKDSMPKKGLR